MKRILTGDRPTGRLHFGHYVGSLSNRVKLQDQYECFFIVADLHTLTTAPEKTSELKENTREQILDYLSVGIDPDKSTIYLQSEIPEVGELAVIFGMLISVPRLQRVPTLKEIMRDLRIKQASFGLLGYPVLQAADILMVRADLVPVGKDQVSHVEVTRDIARAFNNMYGKIFPEPEALVGEVPTLPGIDGQMKMSKSLGNAIYLSDGPDEVKEKVMQMYTDPTRIHPTDPGHIEGNPVFIYHDAFNQNKKEVEELKERYQKGKVGDIEVKESLARALNGFLDPIRKKRAEIAGEKNLVEKILKEGTQKARQEAQETLALAKRAMKMNYFGRF